RRPTRSSRSSRRTRRRRYRSIRSSVAPKLDAHLLTCLVVIRLARYPPPRVPPEMLMSTTVSGFRPGRARIRPTGTRPAPAVAAGDAAAQATEDRQDEDQQEEGEVRAAETARHDGGEDDDRDRHRRHEQLRQQAPDPAAAHGASA